MDEPRGVAPTGDQHARWPVFTFATAGRIRFGEGVIDELAPLVAAKGKRALLVTGSEPGRHAGVIERLRAAGVDATITSIQGEPTTEDAERGVTLAREAGCTVVVGIGGGSALDAGKAIAALLTNGGAPLDYLEVIGAGRTITRPSAPYIAVPTTSGTGAEVTKNAVLESAQHGVKVSLRSDFMLPEVALVDPQLTHSVPPLVTANTGLDALTQVLEPFVSNQCNPLTDALCREGLLRAARSLERAFDEGSDAAARYDMALVSLFGGLALANAKLGAVHGFAGPLGGMFRAPHGALCARMLPWVMAVNVRALRERSPQSAALARYDEIGRLLTGRADAAVDDAIAWIHRLSAKFGVLPLERIGVRASDKPAIIEKAARASSMKGNPIRLRADELEEILELAM